MEGQFDDLQAAMADRYMLDDARSVGSAGPPNQATFRD